MEELRSWLILARVPGLHAGTLLPLLEQFGSLDALQSADRRALSNAGLRDQAIEALLKPDQRLVDLDCRWLEGSERHLITLNSAHYPRLLAEIADAPVALFVEGAVESLHLPQVAVVGSRNPTHAGTENAAAFARQLVANGLAVTSGLALGIDAASHHGALEGGGFTIAVCGTGPDTIYPAKHQQLAERIAASGALVTEFPCCTPPAKQNFPRRNRIISGLALGTLVVEAALQSGSLITARLAATQGREVFAIPGSIHNPFSRGCHELLKQGAKLVETADDIFPELRALAGVASARAAAVESREAPDSLGLSGTLLDKDRKILLDALGFEPAGVDLLVRRTGFRVGEVASMLLILELDGRIESFPGGLYVRAQP